VPDIPLTDQYNGQRVPHQTLWEHEYIVEAAQMRLEQNPQAMRVRRETVEYPFAILMMRMGAIHFLMKRLPSVATEMALNVLAYNLTHDEHRRHQPGPGGNPDVKSLCCYAHRVSVQVAQRGPSLHPG
jgi:hypothetical protein